jgi:hypothetical protein
MLGNAKECIGKEDAVQASEKLYKCAEEAVKVLSGRFKLEEYEEAKRIGRWTTTVLFRAVERIAEVMGRDIEHYWNTTWTLHVEGFHEARLEISYVSRSLEDIEELVRLARKGIRSHPLHIPLQHLFHRFLIQEAIHAHSLK